MAYPFASQIFAPPDDVLDLVVAWIERGEYRGRGVRTRSRAKWQK